LTRDVILWQHSCRTTYYMLQLLYASKLILSIYLVLVRSFVREAFRKTVTDDSKMKLIIFIGF
jgi:hypothetical protein